jgi:hypothetical protein
MNLKEFFVSSGDEFLWLQPEAHVRNFDLLKDAEKFGTMNFRTKNGTLAFSYNPIQDWSFKRTGFLNPAVTIRMPNADSDYALYLPEVFSGGQLHMLNGRPFGWKSEKIGRNTWYFSDKNKNRIMSFSPCVDDEQVKISEQLNILVKVETNRITNQEFSMMINLGFYLIVLHRMDSSLTGRSVL